LGRPHTATDGRGITTTYTYDNRDRTTDVATTGGANVAYTFDGDGNQRSRTDSSGTTTYTMDKLNRETLRTLTDGSTTVLAYTPDGHVDTYTDPTGTVDYGYDTAGRLTTLKDPSGATTTYGYNNDDARTSTTYPGSTVQTVTLDNSNRPKAIKAVHGSTTLTDLAYTYTSGPSSTDGTLVHTRKDNQAGTTVTYTYDSQNRLGKALETDTGGTRTAGWLYCYDDAGNLLSAATNADASSTCDGPQLREYVYNDASELNAPPPTPQGADPWGYNAAGDETYGASLAGARTGETWSDFNQLTALTVGGTSYTAAYSGTDNGERVSLGATTFHNGPEGLAGSTTNGTDTGFTRDPQGTLNSMRTGGTSYYYLTDAQGSVVGLVNAAGTKVDTYTYDPTGQARTTTQTTPQPYRFQGTYLDPTGLYKMGARYYDPTLGRFTQTDPSGKETNPYTAFGNDPANHTDPNGLFGWPEVGSLVVGTAIGVAATVVFSSPLVGGVVGGCAIGALAEGFNGNGAGDMGLACVGGGIAGGVLGKSADFLP
ncbi:RHS repeat-associated core domain-containing protein, partial [Actinacidiphila paucisporea]